MPHLVSGTVANDFLPVVGRFEKLLPLTPYGGPRRFRTQSEVAASCCFGSTDRCPARLGEGT